MNGLDLFSGIGGISVALEPWVRTVAYCEKDRYAQGVLLSRMASGELDSAPIWDDVTTLRKEMLPDIDIIFGGFPCQDISSAGRGAGLEGERSGLFFEIARLVDEIRPSFVFLENVPAITTRGLDRVAAEFSKLRYDCRWTTLSASEFGACHQRKRWFLLAHPSSERLREEGRLRSVQSEKWPSGCGETSSNADGNALRLQSVGLTERRAENEFGFDGVSRSAADSDGEGLEGFRWIKSPIARPVSYNGWKSEPTIRRGANGLSNRVDRVKCLGNSVVPMQVREAFKRIVGLELTPK